MARNKSEGAKRSTVGCECEVASREEKSIKIGGPEHREPETLWMG